MKEQMSRIREALGAAYRGRERFSTDDLWEARVMGHVRSLGTPASPPRFSALFGRFVWRLAPVACALIIALTAGLVNLDYTPEYEITTAFMTDPIVSTVEQLWGR
ncbi:MAG: hypothetical protein QME27_08435 [Syntrophaceae bacterium]|nr:hypothetical protein [Syntrophaceae bacterium]